MADSKDPETKVEFSDSKLAKSSRKTRLRVAGALTVTLLLGVVVSLAMFFTLKESTPQSDRLVDVNLEEGDSLTYRVDQEIEMDNGDSKQRGNYVIFVGIRVLNKSSEEYWFLVSFNASQFSESGDIDYANMTVDYYLVRLRINSSTAIDSFEIYGDNSTNDEQLRLVFGILQLILPSVRRNLYENVDGIRNVTVSGRPEDSPLLPGPVMMHREANTSGKDAVSIKNHFSGADMVGMPSDIDMDFTYSDQSSIKKSNGMVLGGKAYFSEQIHLGENGGYMNTMKMAVKSRVSLIETASFDFPALESIDFRGLFEKLILPKSAPPVFTLNETADSQPLLNETSEVPLIPSRRSRRTPLHSYDNANASLVAEILKEIGPVCLFFHRQFELYSVKILNVNVSLIANLWVTIDEGNMSRIEVKLNLVIGQNVSNAFEEKSVFMVPLHELKDFQLNLPEKRTPLKLVTFVSHCRTLVFGNLSSRAHFLLKLPLQNNSLVPLKLNLQIESSSVVKVSQFKVELTCRGLRATALRLGTFRSSSPSVTLSFCDGKLCVTVLNEFGELKLLSKDFVEIRVCKRWGLVCIKKARRFQCRLRCIKRRWRRTWSSPIYIQHIPAKDDELVQVCNMTKGASSSILLPTSTSLITHTISMTPSIPATTSISSTISQRASLESMGVSTASIAPTGASSVVASMS
ncbi:uncharacterized skeletal organic matrix protein 1-like [Montipora foliosa]|uniref:uncharacterized skeletal organic matrix protein 1-like n=1 Tax=Montipora foliosa TaxID=591990 RepID=UPI0035F21578